MVCSSKECEYLEHTLEKIDKIAIPSLARGTTSFLVLCSTRNSTVAKLVRPTTTFLLTPEQLEMMHDATTPPMASRRSSVSSFDDEYIEFFLAKTYVPLSNLPTPPLSSHSNNNLHQDYPEDILAPGEILDPNLLGMYFPRFFI
jgi:hypothetical protein